MKDKGYVYTLIEVGRGGVYFYLIHGLRHNMLREQLYVCVYRKGEHT